MRYFSSLLKISYASCISGWSSRKFAAIHWFEENGVPGAGSNESRAKWCIRRTSFPYLGMRFRCRHGVGREGARGSATLAGRFSKNRRGCARFAFIDRRVVSGGHPLRCATNVNYPLRRLAAEEGLVPRRLSGRSPGISEALVSVGKKIRKISFFFKNPEKC